MSRNSKNARNLERARQYSKQRKEGGSGAPKTNPAHGKRWTYRQNPEIQKRIAEQLKATQTEKDKTSGKKILENAGGASKD